jgi:TolB-like protein/Tfp pilus assembly protein PilF
MGEVYRARDTRLGREVAIKVLPSEMTADASARRRFEQEARAIAALSHPNILSILHFDEHEGVSFAVTELLKGETLRERIARGRIPSNEAAEIAAAIADGLAAAHARGIIHRDLKPSNISLPADGPVKILDFGLARVTVPQPHESSMTDVMTTQGQVMGTLGYMSPEQLRGEPVGPPADIFALGCILYEMISGEPAFLRSSMSDTLAASLRDEPPDLANMPPALTRLIRHCLEKDPTSREQSAANVAATLRARKRASGSNRLIAAAALTAIIAGIGALVMKWRPAPAHREIRSVLVVPFENATRDSKVDYLSDGIAEGMIDALAEQPSLRVIARTTAFRFKGKSLDLADVRKKLDVDAILSGRLVSAGDTIVIQADLVDTESGRELWGNRFHEQSPNVLDIEQNMVARISEALRGRLTRVSAPATMNPEAYNLYLQGRFYWNKRNAQAISKARDLFQQAITVDPQFALAYSGLADANNMLGSTFHVVPREEGFRSARQAAETALRLNGNLAEAHASLGLLESNEFHWAPAEREFKRALELNPNYTSALLWYSLLQLARNHIDESIALVRKAVQIDPLSAIMVTNLGMRLNVVGNYREGLAAAQKGMDLDPGYQPSYARVGEAYEAMGQRENAAAVYERGSKVSGPAGGAEALLIRANVLRGNASEAGKLLSALQDRAARGKAEHTMLAWAYSAMGDRDLALDALNRAFAAREPTLRDSARTPQLKELRGDPRYDEFLRRLERGF